MGTSTPLTPAAGNWRGATSALRRVSSDRERAEIVDGGIRDAVDQSRSNCRDSDAVARKQLDALWRDLRHDPDAYGLRSGAIAAIDRLVDLTAPRGDGLQTLPVTGHTPAERADSFVEGFSRHVAGSGNGIGDAIIRRAAVTVAREAVTREGIRRQLESGNEVSFGGELFCMIYKLFLGDIVVAAIKTLVQEKIRLVVPILRVTDPLVNVSGWIAEKVVSIIPDPCAEVLNRGPEATLLKVGHDLVEPAVERALGLDGS